MNRFVVIFKWYNMYIYSGSYSVSGGSFYFCLFHSWITSLCNYLLDVLSSLEVMGNCFAVINRVTAVFAFGRGSWGSIYYHAFFNQTKKRNVGTLFGPHIGM